tara:strand:- start:7126 stop:7296 length:171 start_codon:yes stop_codon:yes gene_type:complete
VKEFIVKVKYSGENEIKVLADSSFDAIEKARTHLAQERCLPGLKSSYRIKRPEKRL